MKLFFILFILTYDVYAQNNLATYKKTDDLKTNKEYKVFYIQVGAFKNKKYAIRVLNYLERLNYPLRIEEKQIGMNNYFRLLIGPYRTKEKAYLTKESLPNKYTDSFVVTYNN